MLATWTSDAGASSSDHPDSTPVVLLYQKPVSESTVAYICEHYACKAPTATPAELRQQLESL